MNDLRGSLTPRMANVVKEMRFAGQGSAWDGGSVLVAAIRCSGDVCLSLHFSTQSSGDKLDHFWAVELTSEQRKALAAMLVSYEPVLFESTTNSSSREKHGG